MYRDPAIKAHAEVKQDLGPGQVRAAHTLTLWKIANNE